MVMNDIGILSGCLNQVHPFVMIDIETLGTRSVHPIVEIGICHYREGVYTSKSEYIQPNWNNADPHTLRWWQKQKHWETLKYRINNSKNTTPSMAMQRLIADFAFDDDIKLRNEYLEYYALGPQFDMAFLNHQIPDAIIPWNFRKVRDLRSTFDDLNNGLRPKIEMGNNIPHSAKSDAERQARQLVYILSRTKLKTPMNGPFYETS